MDGAQEHDEIPLVKLMYVSSLPEARRSSSVGVDEGTGERHRISRP